MLEEVLKMVAFGEHPNIMPLLGVCTDAGPGVSLIMPYMKQGSLLNYLKRERSSLIVGDDDEDTTVSSYLLITGHRLISVRMLWRVSSSSLGFW